MKEKVEAALDKIRPALQADLGDVELTGVDEGQNFALKCHNFLIIFLNIL